VSGGHCQYPADWVPLHIRLKSSPTAPNAALSTGGSSFAMGPVAPSPPPGEGGLRCRHVSHGSRPTSQCGRDLVSPCISWNWAHLPTWEGSSVTMCLVVPDPSPRAGGLWRHHVSRGTGPPSGRGGLRCHHVPRSSKPFSRSGRALGVLWIRSKREILSQPTYLVGSTFL
jgi:hypothetical protein